MLAGRLGELLKVTEGYEQAVAAILRDCAEHLVAGRSADAIALVRQLADDQSANASFVHADVPMASTPDLGELAIAARDIVSSADEFSNLLDNIFAHHYVVTDLDAAQQIFEAHPEAKLTTFEGVTFPGFAVPLEIQPAPR